MAQYDFSTLPPFEFENLVNDLLSEHFQTDIESFTIGRDEGIDGRFYKGNNSDSYIIQSKHFPNGKFEKLKNIHKTELPKIKKLKPKKYYLATSIGLTPDNKATLIKNFDGYIKSSRDIFDRTKLNSLLRKYPNVEKNYNRLWIPSTIALTTYLKQVLNNDIETHTQQVIGKAIDNSKSYWITNDYKKAKDIILEKNVLLITGVAGIGKTSLAEQLFLDFIDSGYKPIAVLNEIKEARRMYNINEKQIFFFDDFWGSNFVDATKGNKESAMMDFVRLISQGKNKKLILTSRTNIAEHVYPYMNIYNSTTLKSNEYTISIGNFDSKDKAMILYFFLWNSNLQKDFLEIVIFNKIYEKIIQHKNYNPRLLEFITKNEFLGKISKHEYEEYIFKSLESPELVFSHPYKNQLSAYGRIIVDLIVFSNGSASEKMLKIGYDECKKNISPYDNTPTDFYDISATLLRSFITREQSEYEQSQNIATYRVFNPSISDVVINRYFNSSMIKEFSDYLYCVDTPSGLNFLFSLKGKNAKLSAEIALFHLKRHPDLLEFNNDYIFDGICMCIQLIEIKELKYLISEEIFMNFLRVIKSKTYDLSNNMLKSFYKLIEMFPMSLSELLETHIKLIQNDPPYESLVEMSKYLLAHKNISDIKSINLYQDFIGLFKKAYIQQYLEYYLEDFLNENSWLCTLKHEDYNHEFDYDDITYSFDKDYAAKLLVEENKNIIWQLTIDDAYDLLDLIDLDDYITKDDEESHQSNKNTQLFNYDDKIFKTFISDKYDE